MRWPCPHLLWEQDGPGHSEREVLEEQGPAGFLPLDRGNPGWKQGHKGPGRRARCGGLPCHAGSWGKEGKNVGTLLSMLTLGCFGPFMGGNSLQSPQAELSHHFLPLQCCWGEASSILSLLRRSQAWGKMWQQRPAGVSRDAFSLQPPRSLHASLGTCTALGPRPGGEARGPASCERGEKPPWF